MRCKRIVTVAVFVLAAATAGADWHAGVAAFQNGDFTAAMQAFTAVVDRTPNYAGAHFMLGLTLQRLDRAEEALIALEEANRLEPGHAGYAMAAARALLEVERVDDAKRTLEGVNLEGLPSQQVQLVLAARAQVARAGGDEEGALELLRQAAEVDGANAEIMSQFALALARLARHREAFDAFRRAWEAGRSQAAGRNACAAGMRAAQEAATDRERLDLFRDVATVAAEIHERAPDPGTALLAAEAYLGAGEFSAALTWLDRVDPETAVSLLYKGQAYANLGRLDRAEQSLRRAAEQQPEARLRRQIWNFLGFVLDMGRKYAEAGRAYAQAGNNAKVAEMRDKERMAQQNIAAEEEEQRIRELQRLLREYAEIERRGPAPPP